MLKIINFVASVGSEPACCSAAGRARLRAADHAVPALERAAPRARHYYSAQVSTYLVDCSSVIHICLY